MCHSDGQYTKAEEYLQKELTIKEEIGDKGGVGASYLLCCVRYREHQTNFFNMFLTYF